MTFYTSLDFSFRYLFGIISRCSYFYTFKKFNPFISESYTFCNSEEGHLQAMMYSTVLLSVWAILQISIYLYWLLHSSSATQLHISYIWRIYMSTPLVSIHHAILACVYQVFHGMVKILQLVPQYFYLMWRLTRI